jgi:hypothetical protein
MVIYSTVFFGFMSLMKHHANHSNTNTFGSWALGVNCGVKTAIKVVDQIATKVVRLSYGHPNTRPYKLL